MFKGLIALVVLSISMVGCATQEYSNMGSLTESIKKNGKVYEANASFIQWNEDYAVTARHVTIVKNPDFVCSSGCDMVFFKHKAENFNSSQKWRNAEFGESIKAVGNNIKQFVVEREGKVLKEIVKDNPKAEYFYLVNDADTVGGMSGGPVYAANDNALIGMTIGVSQESKADGVKESLFVPYEIIRVEWEIFQENKKQNL
jgi:hypothetical protein